MSDLHLLKKSPLFRDIQDTDLSGMMSCLGAIRRTYPKHGIIFSEGDPASHVGIVLSGSVQVVKEDYYGNRSLVGITGPSELFGEVFACAGVSTLPVSIIAMEDSDILLVDCKRILTTCSNACEFHNQLVSNLLRIVAEKSLTLHKKIEITSKRTTREKLMAFLMLQAKQHNSPEFTIPYDRQQLADYLVVERSAMSAELGKLQREGILECHRSHFKLLRNIP